MIVAFAVTALAVLAGGLSAAADPACPASSAPACARPEKPLSAGYAAATEHDAAFDRDFGHCFTTVYGIQMHYALTVPVRLLAQDGLTDLLLPPVQDAAPAATGTDISGAGHSLLAERPAAVLDEIDAFYPTH